MTFSRSEAKLHNVVAIAIASTIASINLNTETRHEP